ncbi:MAG: FFLEELY motif protein [Burkholderiaceae bacterium]
MSKRAEWQTHVAQTLERIHVVRGDAAPQVRRALARVQAYQRSRLAQTYEDFLADARIKPAALFFLDELYCTADVAEQRDADVERIVPLMAKVLPQVALDAVGDALSLDAMSADLDHAMAHVLLTQHGDAAQVDEDLYGELYRAVGQPEEREQQLTLLDRTGKTLAQAVRLPLIRPTLAMMEMPARAAGLLRLHTFLAHGLDAFKKLPDPALFLRTIKQRETALMRAIFAG